MQSPQVSERRVDAQALAEMAAFLLQAAGAGPEQAGCVAGHLAEAEMVGRESHGIRLIGLYVERLLSGQLDGRAMPAIVLDRGALGRVDGCRAFGQVAAEFAVAMGIRKARLHGTCAIALANSGHFGRNAAWAEMAAAAGLVSLHFVHGFAASRSVVPFGGREARLGTNPVIIGIPSADGRHLVHDFATAELAANRVRLAFEKGERLQTDAVIRTDGVSTDDPAPFVNAGAALRAFGGFKGYGLNLSSEILAGVLAGGADRTPGLNAMLSFYLDPSRLAGAKGFAEDVQVMLSSLRSAPSAIGMPGVSVPGDRSRRKRRGNGENGVPVGPDLRVALAGAAKKCGATRALYRRWPFLRDADHSRCS